VDLTAADAGECARAKIIIRRLGRPIAELAEQVRASLVKKVEHGSRSLERTAFLHTEPHHHDIMLGYLPLVLTTTREPSNAHHFVCATSGFNSVSNAHMLMILRRVSAFLRSPTYRRLATEGYFAPGTEGEEKGLDFRRRDVWKFLDGIAADDMELRDEGAARRLVANLGQIFGLAATADAEALRAKVSELESYFDGQYAGQKDITDVQTLKGTCREFEAECVWGYLGWQLPNISHLRLGFYTSDIFAPEPTHQRDVAPILALLQKLDPDVVTVALDPEASGPDTHYKVLQAVTAALQAYTASRKRPLTVWGYRNVWFRFAPHEASTIVPVSLETISTLNHMFLNAFESQREAEFPPHDLEGPFCRLAQRVQVEQYGLIETCLGYEWFHKHASPAVRASRGLVFLKEMTVEELVQESMALREIAENF
jgi:glucosamine-6-phosphate deaminase